jgi:hypothetical protein
MDSCASKALVSRSATPLASPASCIHLLSLTPWSCCWSTPLYKMVPELMHVLALVALR